MLLKRSKARSDRVSGWIRFIDTVNSHAYGMMHIGRGKLRQSALDEAIHGKSFLKLTDQTYIRYYKFKNNTNGRAYGNVSNITQEQYFLNNKEIE